MDILRKYWLHISGGVLLAVSLLILFVGEGSNGRPLAVDAPTLTSLVVGFTSGVVIALAFVFLRFLFRKFGKIIFYTSPLILVVIGDALNIDLGTFTEPLAAFVGFVAGISAVSYLLFKSKFFNFTPKTVLPNVFGSSRWATRDDLKEWKLLGKREASNGLFLGKVDGAKDDIVYDGDMHALTVAPTRTGKGATAIIPNLLRSNSSILVVDPKGENARRTVHKRIEMGQQVYVVDPWAVSCEKDKYGEGIDQKHIANFNPLAFLDADDPDLSSDAMLLADALVESNEKDPFWSDEAKALIQGFILYVVTDPDEADHKHLGRIVDSDNPKVISAYEKRLDQLETEKLVLEEKAAEKGQPRIDFDKVYRTAQIFLSNPHKVWRLGSLAHKQMVLKLAFKDKPSYVRNEGYRTANLSMPFNMLKAISGGKNEMVPPVGIEPTLPKETGF